jgi:CRP-like cAMP-binding protein
MNLSHIKWSNHLFAGVPMNVWHIWQELVEPVHLEAGQVLYETGDEVNHVYFPFTSIISLTRILNDGESIEVAMVGSEGAVGVAAFMHSAQTTSNRAVVLRTGYAYRLSAEVAKHAFDTSTDVMQVMLRYIHALIFQISQLLICTRHHTIEQQLSRWLLMYTDRTNDSRVLCTQEAIANTLGVRRERVSKVATEFQAQGFLRYSRGIIEVLRTEGLKSYTCECHAVIANEYTRLRSQ